MFKFMNHKLLSNIIEFFITAYSILTYNKYVFLYPLNLHGIAFFFYSKLKKNMFNVMTSAFIALIITSPNSFFFHLKILHYNIDL